MTLGLINANPVVHAKKERVARTEDLHADDADNFYADNSALQYGNSDRSVPES
ncbi:hypothetical protein C1H46_043523 [Malus baccata]|uniref:Uncharacterized protein n=1 Tax=Malus baccata TaxID=106549 RepID=A0A540K9M4_MALBA|nr:hypothetical protein C1H46_043521 [Malus baccata]TQD70940.1 hypothetical protein C1H46_043523 [Malus baccata]